MERAGAAEDEMYWWLREYIGLKWFGFILQNEAFNDPPIQEKVFEVGLISWATLRAKMYREMKKESADRIAELLEGSSMASQVEMDYSDHWVELSVG